MKKNQPAAPSPSLGEPSAERIQFVHGLQLLVDKFYRFHAGAMNRHEVSAFQICKNELSAFMETVKSGSLNQIHASPTAARELNLKWGRHDARGEYHIEWHAPCGCAYHPEPKPHIHPCIKHAEIDQCEE